MDKSEMKAKAKNSVEQVIDKIASMEQKKNEVQAAMENRFDQQIKNLKSVKDEMLERYEELEKKSGSQWEESREAFSKASEKFKAGFAELKQMVN